MLVVAELDIFQGVTTAPVNGRRLNDFRNSDVETVEEVSDVSSMERVDELFRLFVAEMLVTEVTHSFIRRQVYAGLVHLANKEYYDADSIEGGVEVIPSCPRRSSS